MDVTTVSEGFYVHNKENDSTFNDQDPENLIAIRQNSLGNLQFPNHFRADTWLISELAYIGKIHSLVRCIFKTQYNYNNEQCQKHYRLLFVLSVTTLFYSNFIKN